MTSFSDDLPDSLLLRPPVDAASSVQGITGKTVEERSGVTGYRNLVTGNTGNVTGNPDTGKPPGMRAKFHHFLLDERYPLALNITSVRNLLAG